MKQLWVLLLVLSLSAVVMGSGVATGAERHVSATLAEVDGSGITGRVMLTALPHGGTLVTVTASGLQAGTNYLSLYYENHTCEVEAYEEDDVINRFTASANGRVTFTKKVEDDIDEINSVSIRAVDGFTLKACADTHP